MTSITVTKKNALEVVSFILASVREKALHIEIADEAIEEWVLDIDLLPIEIQNKFQASFILWAEDIHHV